MRYLGILIDQHLTWKHHIDHVVFKIGQNIGLLCKLRRHVLTQTLISIFYQYLIAPHLTYGLLVWGQSCNSHLDELLKLQNRALRFIYFSDFKQHPMLLFFEAGVLPSTFSHFKISELLNWSTKRWENWGS